MNSFALQKILESFAGRVIGPVPDAKDWHLIESAIGRLIPTDFKTIVEYTGGSRMGHCGIRNPAVHDNIYNTLSHSALLRLQLLDGEMAVENLNIGLYPEPSGWVQLAFVDREYFMLKPEGDDIAIVSFSGWEVIEPGMTFAELMWAMFSDRELFGGLGGSIWHDSDRIFGLY